MLQQAGLVFDTAAPQVDEAAEKALRPKRSAETLAQDLARLKAESVSRLAPEALVIGSDQVLVCEGRLFDKPKDRAEAHTHLKALRGREHRLVTAAAIAQDGRVDWTYVEEARLAMRPISDAFLETYLDAMGARALATVGAYEIEGMGAQLLERVEGDHTVVRGLPLFAVLAELRRRGVLAS
jgi:septum formation protein